MAWVRAHLASLATNFFLVHAHRLQQQHAVLGAKIRQFAFPDGARRAALPSTTIGMINSVCMERLGQYIVLRYMSN
jgi:hypothetical protein